MTVEKRLTRSREKMIAGVCSGLGDYLNIDPTLVRIGFVVFGFAGGAAVLAYLIMWIIVPEEKSF
jgi:phage shock protein C